jgi:hypothetical protein
MILLYSKQIFDIDVTTWMTSVIHSCTESSIYSLAVVTRVVFLIPRPPGTVLFSLLLSVAT